MSERMKIKNLTLQAEPKKLFANFNGTFYGNQQQCVEEGGEVG